MIDTKKILHVLNITLFMSVLLYFLKKEGDLLFKHTLKTFMVLDSG